MKTSAVAILILLLTGGALAVANKACKTSDHLWCVRSLHSQNGKALSRAGRTDAREQAANHVGRLSGGLGSVWRGEAISARPLQAEMPLRAVIRCVSLNPECGLGRPTHPPP